MQPLYVAGVDLGVGIEALLAIVAVGVQEVPGVAVGAVEHVLGDGCDVDRLRIAAGHLLDFLRSPEAYHGGRQRHCADGSSREPIHDIALPILASAELSLKSVCQ